MLCLPRLGLRFRVFTNGIVSEEFNGFCVDIDQRIGCFIGLEEMLVLKSTDLSGQRKVIVPHGEVRRAAGGSPNTHTTRIDISKGQPLSPPYFVFDVNPTLKQLKAPESKTAHLYLALLHATCAHPLEDMLTEQTGLESCLNLLQSPECWSPKPFTNTSQQILQQLWNLAPKRSFYPSHLKVQECVSRPLYLDSSCSHECISLAVEALVEDSGKLSYLFNDEPTSLDIKSTFLAERAYVRDEEMLCRGARVIRTTRRETPLQIMNENLLLQGRASEHMRHLASNHCSWKYLLESGSFAIQNYLFSQKNLEGVSDMLETTQDLGSWCDWILPSGFLDFYNFAKGHGPERNEEFVLMLTYLFHSGMKKSIIDILDLVSQHSTEFSNLPTPAHSQYKELHKFSFQRNEVEALLSEGAQTLDGYIALRTRHWLNGVFVSGHRLRLEQEFNDRRNSEINRVVAVAENGWKCGQISFFDLQGALSGAQVLLQSAIWYNNKINSLLTTWRNNWDLHNFVQDLDKRLDRVYTSMNDDEKGIASLDVRTEQCGLYPKFTVTLSDAQIVRETTETKAKRVIKQCLSSHDAARCKGLTDPFIAISGVNLPTFLEANSERIRSDRSCKVAQFMQQELIRSWEAYRQDLQKSRNFRLDTKEPQLLDEESKLLEEIQNTYELREEFWDALCRYLSPDEHDVVGKSVLLSGMWRRILPTRVLPMLCDMTVETSLKNLLLAYGILITKEQRAQRLLKYLKESPAHPNRYREIMNHGFQGWSPREYPEWLLFEIERNITLRERQVAVIKDMVTKDGDGCTIQLQMGEGKTTVLLPLIAATLAREKKLVRVTVPRSLYNSNYILLQFRLGRMLRHKVYLFPCQRDIVINTERTKKIQKVYEECLKESGIVLSRPQDRLSFEAKVIETCLSSAREVAECAFDLQRFIKNHVRDVIDETDEVLSTSQQLMYTIGSQLECDGRQLRWEVAQAVLRLVAKYCSAHDLNESSVLYCPGSPGQFPDKLRILDTDFYEFMIQYIAREILRGGEELNMALSSAERLEAMVRFVTSKECTETLRDDVFQVFPIGQKRQKVLILKGLLGRRILLASLMKRVRVDFGVRKGNTLMAVPYRAKDVPSEKAEFADLDLVIVLTQLAYYANGLNNEQLDVAFALLFKLDLSDREGEYSLWVDGLNHCPEKLKSLSGINLDDLEQKNKELFPLLNRNTRVIDFWLSRTVFLRETMQFSRSLTVSA